MIIINYRRHNNPKDPIWVGVCDMCKSELNCNESELIDDPDGSFVLCVVCGSVTRGFVEKLVKAYGC